MTDFLYPFIDAGEGDAGPLLADLARSARGQGGRQRPTWRRPRWSGSEPLLAAIADVLAARFVAGGRLFTFGNGGSSTDAASVAALFAHPPRGRSLPARSLVADTAVLTALGNDVGLRAGVLPAAHRPRRRPATSPSGCRPAATPRNLLAAFAEARGARPRDRRLRRLRRRRDGPQRRRASTASSSRPTASTGSRRRRPPSRVALWSAVQDRLGNGRPA